MKRFWFFFTFPYNLNAEVLAGEWIAEDKSERIQRSDKSPPGLVNPGCIFGPCVAICLHPPMRLFAQLVGSLAK